MHRFMKIKPHTLKQPRKLLEGKLEITFRIKICHLL